MGLRNIELLKADDYQEGDRHYHSCNERLEKEELVEEKKGGGKVEGGTEITQNKQSMRKGWGWEKEL